MEDSDEEKYRMEDNKKEKYRINHVTRVMRNVLSHDLNRRACRNDDFRRTRKHYSTHSSRQQLSVFTTGNLHKWLSLQRLGRYGIVPCNRVVRCSPYM